VLDLQSYLRALGYLRQDERENDEYDRSTRDAVRRYQEFFKVDQSGVLDADTLAKMRKPRCGNPDVRSLDVAPVSNPWGKSLLTFYVDTLPDPTANPELNTRDKCHAALQSAFSIWGQEARITLQFSPAVSAGASDIKIDWAIPGCGGNACTDCPPDGSQLGMLYSTNDAWAVTPPADPEPIDIIAFACHEVGHALGLCRHSSNAYAIMYPTIPNNRRHLLAVGEDNDVDRIRAIYVAGST
jgi:hypothetical protein